MAKQSLPVSITIAIICILLCFVSSFAPLPPLPKLVCLVGLYPPPINCHLSWWPRAYNARSKQTSTQFPFSYHSIHWYSIEFSEKTSFKLTPIVKIYSVGIIFFWLTGKWPVEITKRIVWNRRPPNLIVHPWYWNVLSPKQVISFAIICRPYVICRSAAPQIAHWAPIVYVNVSSHSAIHWVQFSNLTWTSRTHRQGCFQIMVDLLQISLQQFQCLIRPD